MNRFYISSFLHDFSISMLDVFALFYLYQQDYSLVVIGFYILAGRLFRGFIRHFSSYFMLKSSPQKLMLTGNILRLFYTVIFLGVGEPSSLGNLLIFLLGVVSAASSVVYDTVWDFDFTNFESADGQQKQLSFVWIISGLSGILATMAGGFVAQIWGFEVSLVVAGLILLLSVCPLIGLQTPNTTKNINKIKRSLKLKRLWRIYRQASKISLWSMYFSDLAFWASGLWGLYLAVTIFTDQTYSGLGILFSLSACFSMLLAWLIGKWLEKGYTTPILFISAGLESLIGDLRFFITNVPQVVAHNFLSEQSNGHSLATYG